MLYLKGQPRDQLVLYTTCLEEMIPPENRAATAEAGLMALAYNLKRLFRLGYRPKAFVDALLHRLKTLIRLYEHIQHAIHPKTLFLV